jgi:integrase
VHESLTRALRDLQDGIAARTDERETVAQYLHRWLDSSAKHCVRPRTLAGYRLIIDKHLIPAIGRVPVARLSPNDVQGLLNRKTADGASPQTVRNIHACLRRALAQAVRWGATTRNVATLVDLPRVQRKQVTALSPTDARAILAAVKGDRLEPLVTVTLGTGLRQGEALGLRWQDVDLEAGELEVRHALQRMRGSVQLVEPKTDRSRRRIALAPYAVTVLREHRSASSRSGFGPAPAGRRETSCSPPPLGLR